MAVAKPRRHRRLGTRVVTFFAPGREGELTHHGTACHAHVVVRAGPGAGVLAMGHVDAVVSGDNAVLLLPAEW